MNELDIFSAALDLTKPVDREHFLDEACRERPELRKRIDVLLRNAACASQFLESAAPGIVATVDQPPTELPGTVIGRYKLLEQVGEGGMGVVFVAEQTEPVRRRVALKIIKPGMDTKQVIARFEAERQALAMMDHPNIARVLDAGTTEAGRPYFVMELVRGMPITEYCDKARLAPRQRLELFIDVCQAVQHAHQKGIIHRDLKPSNVMVTTNDGRPVVKVIDFGVAKAVGQQLTERTVYTALTQLVGTPLYMSPEQAELTSNDVDTRSDVYSLGVLLYELLTGQTPFDKETLSKAGLDEMRRIIREDEPLRPSRRFSTLGAQAISTASQHRGLDERRLSKILCGELDWIVMKSLEKDRSRRYESASALATDINRYLSDEPVLACPPTTMYRFQKFARKHKPALATAAAIALCLVLGTTVSAWQAVRATTAEAQANVNAAQAAEQAKVAAEQRDEVKTLADRLQRTLYVAHMNLAKHAWDAGGVELVGDLLAQHRPKPGATDLRGFEWHYLHRLSRSPEVLSIQNTESVNSVAYSPDGKRLVSTSGGARDRKTGTRSAGAVKVWDAETGRELLALKGPSGNRWSAVFSPDGKRLAGTAEDKTVKVWDAGTGQEILTLKNGAWGGGVAFSPDGKLIAGASGELKVWDAQTGQELLTFKGDNGFYGVAFSPDSKRIAGAAENSLKIWDAQTGKELLSLDGSAWTPQSVAFSPDGKRLACCFNEYSVKVWDAQTGQSLLSLKHIGTSSVSFSPDGKTLASGSWVDTLRLWNLETGEELRTVKNGGDRVVYSPDGRHLACSHDDKSIKIWDAQADQESIALKADGEELLALNWDWRRLATVAADKTVNVRDVQTGQLVFTLKGHTVPVMSVAFSSDGKRLASGTTARSPDRAEVKVWDAQTGENLHSLQVPTSPRADNAWRVVFSPDGKRLAGSVGHGEVKLWDVDTGKELFDRKGPGQSIAFSPDSKRLVGASGPQITIWDCETGQELLSLQVDAVYRHRVAFSPDGKRLASSGSGKGGALVLDAQTGKELFKLKGHVSNVRGIAFSPDGTRLATTSNDHTVKLWDAQTGEELLSLQRGDWPKEVDFSPDGCRLAVSEASGGMKTYDATPLPEKP